MNPVHADARAILYHKHSTSARTRFLRLQHDSVCALGEVPALAQVVEQGITPAVRPEVEPHPAPVVRLLADWLEMTPDQFEVESEFQHHLDTPGHCLRVYLIRITTMDPPFEQAERIHARFLELTALRDLPGVELELLRSAYKVIMEG